MLTRSNTISAAAMVSCGRKLGQKPESSPMHNILQIVPSGFWEGHFSVGSKAKSTPKNVGGCRHCGNSKHKKEICFKLHRYLDFMEKVTGQEER